MIFTTHSGGAPLLLAWYRTTDSPCRWLGRRMARA
jgi:hypothetical protein